MAVNLPLELNEFCRQARQLKQILKETKRTFGDINAAGNFNGAQIASAEFSKDEEKEISSVVKKKPCLVVHGQNSYAKSFIVNELFNREILPILNKDDTSVRWRTIHFSYGEKASICLTLPGSYELVDNLVDCDKTWRTIPMEDLLLGDDDDGEFAHNSAVLEVNINHPLLREGSTVLVTSSRPDVAPDDQDFSWCSEEFLPIIIYGISADSLSEKDLKELADVRSNSHSVVMFFVKIPPPASHYQKIPNGKENNKRALIRKKLEKATSPLRLRWNGFFHREESVPDDEDANNYSGNAENNLSQKNCPNLWKQLSDLDFLNSSSSSSSESTSPIPNGDTGKVEFYHVESMFVDDFANFSSIVSFIHNHLQNILIHVGSLINIVHTRCLQTFIITAFDMARDILITPKRLEFAKEREVELFQSLMDMATKKQTEIRMLIAETIACMKTDVLYMAERHEFTGVDISEDGEITSAKDVKICAEQIRELVLGNLNAAIGAKLLSSVDILRDSYTGTLSRCIESLEQSDKSSHESLATTEAFRQILNAAYQVDITVRTSSSFIRFILEKMKQIAHSMPWKTPPLISKEWKRKVANDMIKSLSEARLAKSVCSQVKERLKHSHDTFSSALKQLEVRHTVRLDRTEEQRLKVRKVYAPRVARLALESTSFKDQIMYGMPNMSREVGRGQYGVVYSCDKWAGYAPVAVKSVVPPDDKHWNDLALEFYYTKNVPEHDRIVLLRGSVIDYTYGGGNSPAVLLIMDRLKYDLYAAIKSGLEWVNRLQVAIDVVEGIRFLHSQGLVHRDIKLKNVLLDNKNRGKITDLGFCKPEAMMSGSIVGTPIHMAPELFSGKYDNSVDVYAFGILFWYVCAGHVRLPFNFEQCTSKDMLWTSVKKGTRPEKLPTFDAECWDLMKGCWSGNPSKRPLLGNVQSQLQGIKERCKDQVSSSAGKRQQSRSKHRQPVASTNV